LQNGTGAAAWAFQVQAALPPAREVNAFSPRLQGSRCVALL